MTIDCLSRMNAIYFICLWFILGLRTLILSHNVNITQEGWTRLAMSLASGSSLRMLNIDYNTIGDTTACCLVTALPGATKLESLDMECTDVTDVTGQVNNPWARG